jgi:hypothetical protein
MEDLTIGYGYVPDWFMIVALGFSIYHVYRGYVLRRWIAQTQKHVEEQRAARDDSTFNWSMPTIKKIVVRYVYDTLFHFYCSMLGFVALWLVIYPFFITSEFRDSSGGTGLFIFLVVLSILGVSGILPFVIQLGKRPR